MIQSTVDRAAGVGQSRAVSTILERIQSEYKEMPGLTLTEAQARRLWNIDGPTCRLVLTALLERRFLKCTPNGMYVRGGGEDRPAGS